MDVAHRVGKQSKGNKPRAIVVRLTTHSDRLEVLRARKKLKGSGVSIQEDLTKMNVKLIENLKKYDRIQDAWSWNGKVFARGRNGAGPFVVKPNTNVDTILDIHNKGA